MRIENYSQQNLPILDGQYEFHGQIEAFFTDMSIVDMDASKQRIQIAIKSGDIPKLKQSVRGRPEQEVGKLLSTRFNEDVTFSMNDHYAIRVKKSSPLMASIAHNQSAVFEYLMSYSPDEALEETFDVEIVEDRNPYIVNNLTLLHIASKIGNLRMVQLLVNKIDIMKLTSSGELAIHSACHGGDLAVVKCVYKRAIEIGVSDILQKKAKNGNTVMIYATLSGNITLVKWLLEMGASPEPSEGVTILMSAAYGGSLQMVKYIMDNAQQLNVDLNAKEDSNNVNALFYSVCGGWKDIAAYLFELGSENHRPTDGRSLLAEAARRGQFDMFDFLIKNKEKFGVGIDDVDNNNWNVVGYAITGGNMDIISRIFEMNYQLPKHKQGVTLLHEASFRGYLDVISYLLLNKERFSIDLDECDQFGCNSLMFAAFGGHKELLDMLISKGVSIEKSEDGRNLLMAAATNGHNELVEYLLGEHFKFNIHLDEVDKYGRNALFYPVFAGHFQSMKLILHSGVEPKSAYNSQTVLMKAAQSGNLELFNYLLQKRKRFHFNINDQSNDFWNPLMYAVDGGKVEIFRALLNDGAKPDITLSGRSILMQAASKGNEDMVGEILARLDELAIKINDMDDNGWNALMHAVDGGKISLVKCLLEKGVDVKPAHNGETVVMRAAFKSKQDIVSYFLSNAERYGLSIHDKMESNRNCAYSCIEKGHLDVFKLLLEHGLLYVEDDEKSNLLMVATYSGNEDCIQYFLDNKLMFNIDIHQINERGENILFFAVRSGSLKIFKRFLNLGVVPITDSSGKTLLMEAAMRNSLEIAEYLLDNASKYNVNLLDVTDANVDCLFHAVNDGHIEMFKLLLRHGAKIQTDSNSKNLLMQAALCKEELLMKHLFEKADEYGIDVNATDANGWNCLMYSIHRGQETMFSYLLQNGIAPVTANNGRTLLMQSASKGSLKLIEQLLEDKEDQDVNAKDDSGWNAIFFSASGGHVEVFERLLQAGGEIDTDKNGNTILHQSAFCSRKKFVEHLVAEQAHLDIGLDAKCKDGRNCFFALCQADNCRLELFDLFLKQGIPVEKDKDGVTILMVAAARGDFKVINYLLNNASALKLDLLAKDKLGRNALFYAVTSNKDEVFCQLMVSGIPVEHDNDGRTVLMKAILEGKSKMIMHLINSDWYGLSIHQTDNNHCNSLYPAVESGNIQIFEMLLEQGAVLCKHKEGSNIMMAAAKKGKLEMLRYLVSNAERLGLDIKDADHEGGNLATYAAGYGHKEVFDYAIELGVPIVLMSNGRTLLMLVMYDDHIDMFKHILYQAEDIGIDVNAVTTLGHNAVFYSVEVGNIDMFKLLLANGAHIANGDDQENILMRAIYKGFEEMALYLLKNRKELNIDVDHRDNRERTALYKAVESGSLVLVKALFVAGAKPNRSNYMGETLLMTALSKGHPHIVNFLLDHKEEFKMDTIGRDFQSSNVLFYVLDFGTEEHMRRLLQGGVPIEKNIFDTDPLFKCIDKRNFSMFIAMVKYGCNVKDAINRKNLKNLSPINVCVMKNQRAFLHLLKGLYDAEVDAAGTGPTCLMLACKTLDAKVCEYILKEFCVTPSQVNSLGRSALHATVETCVIMPRYVEKKIEVLKILLEHGANINSMDKEGFTPLLLLCSTAEPLDIDEIKVVTYLLEKGTFVNWKTNKGYNALHCCMVRDTEPPVETLASLEQGGIDINARDYEGRTPLMLACSNGWTKTVLALMQYDVDLNIIDESDGTAGDYCKSENIELARLLSLLFEQSKFTLDIKQMLEHLTQ